MFNFKFTDPRTQWLSVAGAPEVHEFMAVWVALAKGKLPTKDIWDRRRINKIRFMLSTVQKRRDWRFLMEVAVIAIIRDARKRRLLLRFRAATKNFKLRRGTLGQSNFDFLKIMLILPKDLSRRLPM